MLFSRRGVQVPDWQAGITEHYALHSRYTVGLQVRQGVALAPSLFTHSRRLRLRADAQRSALVLCLRGESTLHTGAGAWSLRAGEVAVCGERGWTLQNQKDFTFLLVDWQPGLLSTRHLASSAPAPLPGKAIERLRTTAAPLVEAGTDEARAAPVVAELLRILAAEGLPFDAVEAGDLREPLEAWAIPLAREVDRAICNLAEKPMLADIERRLGWSERSIRRRLHALLNQIQSTVDGGWRELLQAWRIYAGVALMSHPQATTEKVASLLGYGSPVAFCDAFALTGLPSPGSIRSALRNL